MMKRTGAPILALVLAAMPLPLAAETGPQPPPELVALVKSLKPQHGKVAIAAAKASLDLGDAYDFYGPEDAKKILVNIWGNPPQAAEGMLGLVMPAGASPLGDSWGAVVTFEDTGYVSDSDAAEVDYGAIIDQMREGESEANEKRKEGGYPAIHLAGWAEQPHYDKTSHSVVWARDLQFADQKEHSLNYDVRTLGRNGVLSLNLVSSMTQLPKIRGAAQAFTAHAAFDPGSRYEDFDPSLDRKAEYGIGGLVAAGVGVAVAKKLGLLAILLKFIKPIAIGAIAAFVALRNRIAGLFRRD